MNSTPTFTTLVLILLCFGSLPGVNQVQAQDIEIGAYKTNIYGSFVRLRDSSKWGESLTVYLFAKRLFTRNIQGIKRGNVGSPEKFIARIGQAPVVTLHLALKPGAKTCSKENLTALVAQFQQREDMPLGLTTDNLVNIDLRKKEEDPKKPVVVSLECELKEGAIFSLVIDAEFKFPSNEEKISTLIDDGDEALTIAFDFAVNSTIERTK
jgi:hypothetical protein